MKTVVNTLVIAILGSNQNDDKNRNACCIVEDPSHIRSKDFQSVVDILLRHGADKAKANRKHKAPQDYLS